MRGERPRAFRCPSPDQVNTALLPEHQLVQVHCKAPLAVLLDRYANRSRHAAHHDEQELKELPARYESGAHDALRLRRDLIELDTTQPVDLDALADRVRECG